MQVDPCELDVKASYRLLISSIVPRPIALVSTVGENGVKNAARNIRLTGEFVVNVVDVKSLKPVGRLGESLYCNVRDIFEMKRPRPGRAPEATEHDPS